MVLRKLRWLPAAVLAAVAVLAAPGVSRADTVIQVQEVGGSFSQSYTLATLPTSFNTTNFNNVQITVTTSTLNQPPTGQAGHTLSTTLNALAGSNFTPGSGLTITVTDNGFLNSNPGSDGFFVGNVSTTAAFANTSNTGTATLSGPTSPVTLGPTTASATPLAAGSASFISPSPTSPNVSGIPGQFTIQQVLDFRVTTVTDPSASFTAGVSNSVITSAAVPAPPALFLALAAVPAFGLRRVLRKKA